MTTDSGADLADHRWIAHSVVEREGRILLLRRKASRYLGGQWDIPGGTVEAGESPADAAQREVREESGLLVEVTEEISHFTNADTHGRPICFHTVTFRGVEHAPGTVVLHPDEHDDFRWLPPVDALGLDLVWHVRRTLEGSTPAPSAGSRTRRSECS